MNFLKPDSPAMNFLSTVADLIILNLLFVICSIPIVTIGAAYSAKYYVAMKVIRGEGTGVFVPFFKAFGRNFKQATLVWLVMLVAIAIIILDWRWIIDQGWNNTPFIYKLGVIVISVAAWLMTISIFPTISRYEMKTLELFKAALIFVIIKFIPLALITLLMVGSVVACLWYAQWFPLIYVFTSTTITYFLSLTFIKQFDKLEKVQEDKLKAIAEEKRRKAEEAKGIQEEDATGNVSLAGSKIVAKELEKKSESEPDAVEDKSGNKFTRFIRTEKKKLKDLSPKQKLVYFAQYYLPATVLVLCFIGAIVWYGHDIYKSKMRVLNGGLINCHVTEEGREYATTGFLTWGGYGSNRTSMLLDSDLNFKSDLEYEEKYLEVAFRASILTGTYDYLIIREDAVYNYAILDYFQNLNEVIDMNNFSEDDLYYYELTDEEKAALKQGISLNDLFSTGEEETDEPVPVAIKLTDDIERKLGLDEEYTYYIAFANASDAAAKKDNVRFIEYLFGKC